MIKFYLKTPLITDNAETHKEKIEKTQWSNLQESHKPLIPIMKKVLTSGSMSVFRQDVDEILKLPGLQSCPGSNGLPEYPGEQFSQRRP